MSVIKKIAKQRFLFPFYFGGEGGGAGGGKLYDPPNSQKWA